MFITKSFFRGGAGLRIARNALNRVGHRALRIFPPDSIASQTPGPFQTFGPVRSHPKTFWEYEGMKPSKHRETPHTHGPLDHHSAATQHVRRLRTLLPTASPSNRPSSTPPATSILCSGDLRPEPRHLRFLPVANPHIFSRFTASLSSPRPRFQALFHLLAPGSQPLLHSPRPRFSAHRQRQPATKRPGTRSVWP